MDIIKRRILHNIIFSLPFKVGLSPTQKICAICLIGKPFQIDKICFLFHLKSSFRSQVIYAFVTTFWSCRKNGLIRKLTSKFMTSQPGLQTIAIHILPNISQSKGNQALKFGQLVEYYKGNIFLQKLCGT